MGPDLATVAVLALGTVAAAFLVLCVAGVVLLRRRAARTRSGASRSAGDPRSAGRGSRRARDSSADLLQNGRRRSDGPDAVGSVLVRADEAVRAGADELAFATAQFGEERTRAFAAALETARGDLVAAFEAQHRLDAEPAAGERLRQERASRVRVLAERARAAVEEESARFRALRGREADAPETLRQTRDRLAATRDRRSAADEVLTRLRADYVADALATIEGNLGLADTALDAAQAAADRAEDELAASRVTAVGDALEQAQARIRAAGAALDAIDHRRDELADAEAGVAAIASEQAAAVQQARVVRDAPPDPDSGARVGAAIARLESELAAVTRSGRGPRDPIGELDRLVDASDALDVAVAAARNQQRRLEGAREALGGALVSARTQLRAVSDYIGAHGGSAGARTRLAEGERELLLAEHEADPVAALDAARRAQTHARDADALARYAD